MAPSPSSAQPGAASLDGHYPRPQLRRSQWRDLGGSWDFGFDEDLVEVGENWPQPGVLPRLITVPFPPESKASGIAEPGFHPVVWYRRSITTDDVRAAGLGSQGDRLLLHFGAVDYRADVWFGGDYLGHHEGGQTPFSFDITALVVDRVGDGAAGAAADPVGGQAVWSLVVRAEDDPLDVAQPRGKQDWQLEPHGIWYHRTTGIWQPVWLEAVPGLHVTSLSWSSDLPGGTVTLDVELNERPVQPVTVAVTLTHGEEVVAKVRVSQDRPRGRVVITLPQQGNGQAYEGLLWSPEQPRLVDATVELGGDGSRAADTTRSYLGLRAVAWADRHFLLNDRPYYIRAVLAQGYWPDSHLAAPGAEALRQEVQLIKDLGFNTARVHEKAEDPRFLYWADRLGVMVWEECPSAYEFSSTAAERTTREWTDIIRRDISHPSIVTWVPLNESWGVQHAAHDPAQLHFTQALYHLTKSLDPTRPVVSNDGWEHADSDLWTVHDYGITRADLAANYADRSTVEELFAGIGPLGRRMKLIDQPDRGQPFVVSEFGGVSYAPDDVERAWGYLTASDEEAYEQALRALFEALQSSPVLAGFCYTQLSDTLQEANGLTGPDRRPKIAAARIRAIVLGENVDLSSHRRPKRPTEQSHRSISEHTQAFDQLADTRHADSVGSG